MDRTARVTRSLHFFGYDGVKITLLLGGIIFVVCRRSSGSSPPGPRSG